MPIQPNDPSCQASSIHVSIIWAKDGSLPAAWRGLHHCMSPLAHRASTVRGVRVRLRSDSGDSSAISDRRDRAAWGPSRVGGTGLHPQRFESAYRDTDGTDGADAGSCSGDDDYCVVQSSHVPPSILDASLSRQFGSPLLPVWLGETVVQLA